MVHIAVSAISEQFEKARASQGDASKREYQAENHGMLYVISFIVSKGTINIFCVITWAIIRLHMLKDFWHLIQIRGHNVLTHGIEQWDEIIACYKYNSSRC